MSRIPKTWQIRKLGEIVSFDNGCWGPENIERGVSVLRSTNFNNDGTISFEKIAKRHLNQEALNDKYLKEGDILLERSGGGPQQPVGRVVYFAGIKEKHYFGNFITRISAKENIFSKFLFYILYSFHQQGVTNRLQNQTTGIRNLRFKEYLQLQIPLPPLSIQHRIAKKIDELFEKIDKAKKLREWAIEDTENIIPAALNEIFSSGKKGWEMKKLGNSEVAEIIMGQSPPSEFYNDKGEGLPFYQGKADFGFLYPTPKKWCNNPQKIAKKNDILISIRAPVGPTNICVEDSCIGRGLTAIRSKSKLNYMYLLYWIRFKESEIAEIGQGSTFGAIRKEDIEQLEIPFPPLPDQHRIVKYLDSLQTQTQRLKQFQSETQKELDDLKKSILDKAFKGEL